MTKVWERKKLQNQKKIFKFIINSDLCAAEKLNLFEIAETVSVWAWVGRYRGERE